VWIDVDDEAPHFNPAPAEEVRKWFSYYDYDRSAPLDAQVVEVKETARWRREKIEYTGAERERTVAYLYLPPGAKAPYQTIHLIPAGDVRYRLRTVSQSIEADYPLFIDAGRAVFAVVLRGYLERDRPPGWIKPDYASIERVEDFAHDVIDARRGLDYLLSRDDVDAEGLAMLGSSFGGPIMAQPAIESRYRAVVFSGIGLGGLDAHPAANMINFTPLVRPPKLLAHGRYDEAAPLETAARPLLKLMSGPKELIVFECAHRVDPEHLAPAVSAWLDHTLGPAARK
jgi:dienelactone hydrolase